MSDTTKCRQPNGMHDLSEIVLSSLEIDGVAYRIDPPARLQPELDASGQLLAASDEGLGIDMHAESREELIEVIEGVLVDHWRRIVSADDARLTRGARELKRKLSERISHRLQVDPGR